MTRSILPPTVQYILVGLTVAGVSLAFLARRYPHVHWLQLFRLNRPYDAARDRHLDHAWTAPDGTRFKKQPPRKPDDLRSQFRDFIGSFPRLPEEQRKKMRRRSNVYAGVQFILLGLGLPFGYYILSMMMFFNEVTRAENILLFAVSGACIMLGIVAIVRSAKD